MSSKNWELEPKEVFIVSKVKECVLVPLRRKGELGRKMDPCECSHYRCLDDGEESEVCALNYNRKTCKPESKWNKWLDLFGDNKPEKEKRLCSQCCIKKENVLLINNNYRFVCRSCYKKLIKKGKIKEDKNG